MNVTLPLDVVTGFCLALTRLLGLFLFAPVFGHNALPARVRLALALSLAWWIAPQVALDPGTADFSLGAALVREAAIGVTLGFAASIVFSGFALMGEFASVQGGLGAAAALDPSTGANSVVLTSLIGTLAGLVFLAIGGHHMVLRGVFLSFTALPAGGGGLPTDALANLARLGSVVFEVAVRLAAPFTATMLVSNLAVGMLGRAIPQLNLISLQLPAQIALTLLILALAAGPFIESIADTLAHEVPRALTLLWSAP